MLHPLRLVTRRLKGAAVRWARLGTTGWVVLTALATVSPFARADVPQGAPSARVDLPQGSDVADRARASYAAGTRAFGEKRFVEAAQQFEDAAARLPSAIALFTAALSWERASDMARAADGYGRALELGGLDEKQTQKAQERLAALEVNLASVRVTGPRGTWAQMEGGSNAPIPVTLHGSAGAHVLLVTPPAGDALGPEVSVRCTILLTLGKRLNHDVTPTPGHGLPLGPPTAGAPAAQAGVVVDPSTATRQLAPSPSPAPSSSSGSGKLATAGFALAGVGVAAEIAAAIVWWGPAMGARDDYRDGLGTRDRAVGYQTLTNVAVVGGALLVGAGAALVVVGRKPAAADPAGTARPVLGIRVGLGGAALAGEW